MSKITFDISNVDASRHDWSGQKWSLNVSIMAEGSHDLSVIMAELERRFRGVQQG